MKGQYWAGLGFLFEGLIVVRFVVFCWEICSFIVGRFVVFCWEICSFIVGRFVVFPLYLFGTVILLEDL